MARINLPAFRRYGVVMLVVAIAVMIRRALWPVLGAELPFLMLWPAVMICAWYGGLGAGLLATLLATVIATLLFFEPSGSLASVTREGWIGMASFAGLGSVISLLLELLHRARRRVEDHARELFEQGERFRVTLASIGDAVLATDAKGRVLFLNEVAQALTDWKLEEAVGLPFARVMRIVNEQTGQPAVNPVERVLATGRVVGLANHTVLLSRGGREVPIDDSAAPIRDAAGTVVGVVLVLHDITEQRQAQEALQEVDRRKDEFLAMLGHELRNPLAPIRSAVEILRLAGADGPDSRHALEVIGRQVRHMARLVDDLLDVSRISRGKIRLEKRRVALAVVLASAVEAARPRIDARRHELTVCLPPEAVWLEADAVRLAQVFANLLNNAAKYTEEGGRIRLTAECDGAEVVVYVRDNGIGISPEMLPRVFELFTQAERALGRSEGGLGVGLALVRTLVEMHGGRVEAHSGGAGKGSEFVVRLPVLRAPSKEESGQGVARVEVTGPSRRVLVVDDNRDAAESLAKFLALSGHDVRTAHDGKAALEAARAFRPEVVLLDIGLPGMDGYQVARRLREQEGERHAFLAALTGYGQEDDRRRSREAGFDAHLVKPTDPDDLLALVARCGRLATK
jgi:PAS domain S-box-containing protein